MHKILSLFCILILTSSPLQADQLKIAGTEIPGLLDVDGKGPYNILFDAIAADSGLDIKLYPMPLARSVYAYNSGNYDGFFPATISLVQIKSLETIPFNRVKALIFTAPGTLPIRSIEEIKGLSVGILRSFTYPDIIKKASFNALLVKNEEQSIKMLLRGRLDAFFGLVPDVYLALQKLEGNIELSVDKSVN
ncbi:MAG: transporter substrate-binding domain-containing protein, partial [Sneathiella sp.]|nr:transporter substrate-binding domain-containing protein [Sneathiella sp.]